MALPSGPIEPSVVSRVSAAVHRLVGPAQGASWGVGALTILAISAIFTGPVGLFVAGMFLVYGFPVWAFARNQRRLTKKGSELATSVGEVQELIDSDAAAFRRVMTAIIPWRTQIDKPEPVPAQRTRSFAERPYATTRAIEPASFPDAWDDRSFWRALTTTERNALTAVARECIYAPGTALCREGQPADHVIVIRSGWASVSVEGRNGQRTIARRGPGDLIGERAALRKGSRSATVIATETIRAYVVVTEDFAAFLEYHPRVLDVLEGQIYGRLTEDRLSPSLPSWRGQNCSILFTDIAAFGALHRSDGDRRTMRSVMYRILREAFDDSGVRWARCFHDDRGDGALVVVPPSTPTSSVVDALLTYLAAGLRRHNRDAGDAIRMQLRVALEVGPVVSDPEGVSGHAIIHAARLLESPILKRQLAETAADLGLIVSRYVYDNVITDEFGSAGYQQVRFQMKESRITAWMHLAGSHQ